MRLLNIAAICCVAAIAISCMGGKGGNRGASLNSQGSVSDESKGASETVTEKSDSLLDHPIVNVYLENSGSMNGYVDNGKTDFQQSVYNYICDVKISKLPSEINMNFINSQIISKGSVIDDFINKLTPNDFKTSAGNRGTTDIADVFKQVLARTNDNTLSIFISDCIFSPGSINSPDAYLANQQVGIKECVADYLLKNKNLAIMVYQMKSKFNGIYYDYRNKPHLFNGERPYYIWVMGHPLNIARLRMSIPEDRFMGGVSNYWCCYSYEKPFNVSYSILPNPKKGDFRLNNNSLSHVSMDQNKDFSFTIGIQYGYHQVLLGDDYLLDTDNYARIMNKSTQDNMFIVVDKNFVTSSPATHNISLSTNGYIPTGDIEIALCCNAPKWCYEMTDFDDSVLTAENVGKTYGLQYMFDGIQQAFTAGTSNNYLRMKFNIK